MSENKTHWLQSPNKNYLGHWDLPENEDLILTIKSAKWEAIKNPVTNKVDEGRVVRFEEDVKPFICNQGNAQSISKSTGIKFMEDSIGCKIQLYIGAHMDRTTKENIDVIRVRSEKVEITLPELNPDHEKWKGAKKAIKDNNVTIDAIKKNYILSTENEALLCDSK